LKKFQFQKRKISLFFFRKNGRAKSKKMEGKFFGFWSFSEKNGGRAYIVLYFWPPLTQTHPFAGGKQGTPRNNSVEIVSNHLTI